MDDHPIDPVRSGKGIPVLEPVPPVLLVIAGITSIQFGAALSATLFDDAGPAGVSLVRLVFAALVLLAVWRPWRRPHDAASIRIAVVLGLILGGMNLMFLMAVERIPLGVVVTIEFLGPIAVATILSRRRSDLVWVALALAGVLLLAEPWHAEGGLDSLGVGIALVAAVLWGAYIVVAERAGHRFDGGDGVAIAMVAAVALVLVPGLVADGENLLNVHLLAVGFVVSLLGSAIPYTLETEALRRIPTNVFGTLMSLEPALGALAGFIVLGQALGAREIVAIVIVVAASVGVMRRAGAIATPEAPMDA